VYEHDLAIKVMLFVELEQRSAQVTVWNNIGNMQRNAKRWRKAEATYQQSLSVARNLSDHSQVAWALYSLGLLAHDQEHGDNALNHYHQALRIFVELDQRSAQRTVWDSVGDTQRNTQ
jgi:tetratricopeptide (TPR) repeat protein